MLKAELKNKIIMREFIDGIPEESIVFEEGTVEVVREVKKQNGYKQFLIYDERINDSTVVFENLLDFRF